CRGRSHRLDKRSLPGSAETAAGWLRAIGIERGRPERAVAQLAFLRVAGVNPVATLRSDKDYSLKEKCMETAPTLILYTVTGK
ncbi:hypothetical protein, partial [Shinella sp.]